MYKELKNQKPWQAVTALAVVQAALMTPAAMAQDNGGGGGQMQVLAPIMVTAEKSLEDVKDIPAAISVVSGEQIEASHMDNITELANQVPNLHISTWGGRRNTPIFIRGIGATYGEPAVGFNVDGVSYSGDGMFDLDLTQIERVEVLRGPQGTLYGRNTLAGVINIITKKPSNEVKGQALVDIGNYGR